MRFVSSVVNRLLHLCASMSALNRISMPKKNALGFSTRSIHAGNEADPSTGAVAPPIFATSTYAQEELGKTKGYDYSRAGNPTRTRLEQNLASLEGGIAAPVFASGMAAVGAICHLMKAGDHIVASNNLYGGVPRLFNQLMTNFGLEFTYVDTADARNVRAGDSQEHALRLHRDADESADGSDRYCSGQPDRAQARLRSDRRQHFHVAVFPAAHHGSARTW